MKRPKLVRFSAIAADKKINIDLFAAFCSKANTSEIPIGSLNLLSKNQFRIRIVGINGQGQNIFSREYDTNHFGLLSVNIPHTKNEQVIKSLVLYETSLIENYHFHLGTYLPLVIKNPKNIIIADFDKTLVDTRYSSLKEVYYSLNRPLSFFPEIKKSTELFRNYINKNYQPFVISASPHFYHDAINHWLSTNQIFVHQIKLKDYRNFFSLFEGTLFKKDLKQQGFYKLSQIIETLNIVGIPKNLVLMGDGFESDTFIYLTLFTLLKTNTSPWSLWDSIKSDHQFLLTPKQSAYFLTNFNILREKANKVDCNIKIYIRCNEKNYEDVQQRTFLNSYINEVKSNVNYYIG